MSTLLTPVVPMTLLDAVNQMLEAVSLASVNSLLPEHLDEKALEAIRHVGWQSRQVQLNKGVGWHFNTLDNYTLTPDIEGHIDLPPHFTLVLPDIRRTPEDVKFTKRGNRLFDLKNNTDVWTREVIAKVVQTLEFDQLPEPFRWYITAAAGRAFGLPRQPDSVTFRFSAETVQEALETAETFDAMEGGAYLGGTSQHVANMRRKR